jgi:hypothetical protein
MKLAAKLPHGGGRRPRRDAFYKFVITKTHHSARCDFTGQTFASAARTNMNSAQLPFLFEQEFFRSKNDLTSK